MSTILIVDDLRANRRDLVTLLAGRGHRLLEAMDGREGLAVVQAERPNLVITDMFMPVMDGQEFIRQLRLDPATSRTPVLFYTAPYGRREARALARTNGVAFVLTRPAEPESLLSVVDRMLRGETEEDLFPEAALFTAGDAQHLRLLSDKARLSEEAEELRTANVRLRAVINIGLDAGSERDPGRRLRNLGLAACDLFGATYVTVGLLDREGRSVQQIVTWGVDATGGMKAGDAVEGALGAALAEGRSLRGENADGDPAGLGLPASHPEVRAYLVAPLASPSRIHGWICLVGNEGRTFTDDDEHLVTALAGQVGRIYELEQEIVERRQAESALRLERDRVQRYLDAAEVMLLNLDVAGRITMINRKGCDLLGWTERELLGRYWIETCLPARIRDEMRERLGRLGPEPSVLENPVLTRSGQERLIEWRNTVARGDAGQAIGTLSSGTDITERSAALEALRTAEERMRFALENAEVGIWDMDYTTGALTWSETLEAQYGMQPGTFGGTFEAFLEAVHPEDRDDVRETVGKAMESGADFIIQHRTVWPDGTVRWLSGSGRIVLDDQGQPLRGVGISQDVTRRRSLEAQYLQAQKMEAVGRLVGGIAHDFNNLVTAILGYCELLLADLEEGDPRREDLLEVQKAGESAAGLTRQLLAFSRQQIIEPVLLDLNEVVAGMRAMLVRVIGEDVRIVLSLEPDLGRLEADRGQVEQIVMNLAVNARDAMPGGGTLTLQTANALLDEDYADTHVSVAPGRYVALRVTDTGTGMTPEVKARLFEPFFTTKGLGKGTGLGLSTVHGIVAQSRGSIGVYTELGLGTAVNVYFPVADVPAAALEGPPAAPAPRAGTQTVLVVEDVKELGDVTRRLLERLGYSVLLATDAEEALDLFDRTPSIDLVLTDVVMPGVSGPELSRRLVERRPGLKVIYMSGYTEDAIVHHGVVRPGVDLIHKPFTSETLSRKFQEVLDRKGHPTTTTAAGR